jgi:hypothetical protein
MTNKNLLDLLDKDEIESCKKYAEALISGLKKSVEHLNGHAKERQSWQANLRGYDVFEVEASSEEEAKEIAQEEFMERDIDYNDYVKIIGNDYYVDFVEVIE